MATPLSSVKEIEDAINSFTRGIPTMERDQFDRIYALLKDLTLYSDGKIVSNLKNLKIVNRVKNELDSITSSDKYIDKVGKLRDVIGNVSTLQAAYLSKAFEDFEPPKLVPELEKMAFENTVSSLTDAGVNENVVNVAADIVESHVRDGSSFTKLVDELKENLVSNKETDSRLLSYAKTNINDTLSGFARNYHSLVTKDLGLEWFGYVGSLVEDSRALCRALVHKHYIHISELGSIASGKVDGETGMDYHGKYHSFKEGMMPGTNASNFQNRAGGFNCSHLLVPVSSETVPSSIRRKFEKQIEADDDEIADSRPRRK